MRLAMICKVLMVTLVVCAGLSMRAINGHAQRAATDTTAAVDSLKTSSFTFIPVLFYTPETKLGAGASAIYLRKSHFRKNARPSTISPTLIFTQNSQIAADLGLELYLQDERYQVNSNISFVKFPDLFYGVGPDTPDSAEEEYTQRTYFLSVSGLREVRRNLRVGVNYVFGDATLTEKEAGGILEDGAITGSDGGRVSGAGATMTWDTRDKIYAPRTGGFYIASATVYGNLIGSDFDFSQYSLDLRRFLPLFEKGTIAFQLLGAFNAGDPPFQFLSQLGGPNILRGHYTGRYRDRHMLVAQAEYRRPLWWRINGAVFGGVGEVAPDFSGWDWDNVRYSVGGGLRFVMDREEGVSIRLDFAGGGDQVGPYLTFNEAF